MPIFNLLRQKRQEVLFFIFSATSLEFYKELLNFQFSMKSDD